MHTSEILVFIAPKAFNGHFGSRDLLMCRVREENLRMVRGEMGF